MNKRSYKIIFAHFEVGVDYVLQFPSKSQYIPCTFVKSTEKGYNFKTIETDRFLLKPHVYPSKYKDEKGGVLYAVPKRITIKKQIKY